MSRPMSVISHFPRFAAGCPDGAGRDQLCHGQSVHGVAQAGTPRGGRPQRRPERRRRRDQSAERRSSDPARLLHRCHPLQPRIHDPIRQDAAHAHARRLERRRPPRLGGGGRGRHGGVGASRQGRRDVFPSRSAQRRKESVCGGGRQLHPEELCQQRSTHTRPGDCRPASEQGLRPSQRCTESAALHQRTRGDDRSGARGDLRDRHEQRRQARSGDDRPGRAAGKGRRAFSCSSASRPVSPSSLRCANSCSAKSRSRLASRISTTTATRTCTC